MALQVTIDALLLGGLYALMALGLALSFGVTQILNFAHGEAVMLGAYGAFFAFSLLGIDPLLALPLVALVGFGAGVLLFRGVLWRLLSAPQINQILLTFGIGLILSNVAAIAFSADMRSTNPWYAAQAIQIGGAFVPVGRFVAFAVACLLAIALWWWLHRTEYGRACRAVSQNAMAVRLAGVNVQAVYSIAFGVSIAIAAATGAVFSAITPVTPFMGFPLVIKAFAIIVLGGIGTLGGAMLGAFLLGLLETLVAYFVPDGSGWADGVAFAALFVILVVRPRGLLGHALDA